jgi:hypothetical protein
MAYSDAWVDTVEDAEFKALVDSQSGMDARRRDKLFLLPTAPRSDCWINIVRGWAEENGRAPSRRPDLRNRGRRVLTGRTVPCALRRRFLTELGAML